MHCRRGGPVSLPDDNTEQRPSATSASVPPPYNPQMPSAVEVRRQVGFLQILANRSPLLARVLGSPPYNMSPPLIQQVSFNSSKKSIVFTFDTNRVSTLKIANYDK